MNQSRQMSLAALEGDDLDDLTSDERKLLNEGITAGIAGTIIDPDPLGAVTRVIINNGACATCGV